MNPLKKKPRTASLSHSIDKPDWMRIRFPVHLEDSNAKTVRDDLSKKGLNTVCESASCPNLHHCWSRKTATYMLGGDVCTRKCLYCDVASGKPGALDATEPEKVGESALALNLNYVVLTAVNRDDLEDGGAAHFKLTIHEIKKRLPECRIEVLIPDFKGKKESIEIIFSAKPDIINHNIETVKNLFSKVAPQKKYETSLNVLKQISENGFITKSGLILGLGESESEIIECLKDLKEAGVTMLTIGQYLQPTPYHYPVQEYIKPEIFHKYKNYAKELGFRHVESGPLVRSSYHADEQASSFE